MCVSPKEFKEFHGVRIAQYQIYKDEVLEMMHKFEKHAANNKDSRLFKLNISIIEYCTEALKEMEKIPVQ